MFRYPQQAPFIRISIPFVIGILMARNGIYQLETTFCLIFLSLVAMFRHSIKRNTEYRHAWVFISIAYCGLGCLAYVRTIPSPCIIADLDSKLGEGIFVVAKDDHSIKPRDDRFIGWLLPEAHGCVIKSEKIGVEVYLGRSIDQPEDLDGVLLIQGTLRRISNLSSHRFDFKQYMEDRSIYYQLYARQLDPLDVANPHQSQIRKWSKSIRKNLLGKLQDRFNGDTLGILTAVLLGNKELLGKETKNTFARSGTMHVLAVSGLHVGIVVFIFYKLMALVGRMFQSHFLIRWCLLVLVVLFYTLMTGGAPPVKRAGLMFSLLALGEFKNGSKNRYNILAFAALLLLMLDPRSLFSVSFQMSYLAVISIVFFYFKIYSLIRIESRVFNWIWQLTAVGLAAQILTFPLVIYYFNQYPLGFVFGGLVAVTSVYVTLMAGYFLLAFGDIIFWIDRALTYLISKTIEIEIYLLHIIANIPFGTIENIWLTKYELFLIYFLLALVMWSVQSANWIYAFFTIALTSVFISYKSIQHIRRTHLEKNKIDYYTSEVHRRLVDHKVLEVLDDDKLQSKNYRIIR